VRIKRKLISAECDKFGSSEIEDLAFSIMTTQQRKKFESENELDMAYSIKDIGQVQNEHLQAEGYHIHDDEGGAAESKEFH